MKLELEDVIKINDDMTPAFLNAISFWSCALVLTLIVVGVRNTAGIVLTLATLVLCLLLAYIPMKHVFSKSLFGEEAYRYMTLPISFRVWVMAKICSVTRALCTAVMILMLCGGYYIIAMFGAGTSGYNDLLALMASAMMNMHAAMSGGILTTSAVFFILISAPIAALVESFFISAMILYGVIVKNLLDPRREKPQTAIAIAIIGILVYPAVSFICVWLPGLFFQKDLAIPQLIIAAVLKLAFTYALARDAANLLEKKYALN